MNDSWNVTISPEISVSEAEKIKVLLVSVDWNRDMSRTPMLAPAFLVAHSRRDPQIRSRVEFEIRQFCMNDPVEIIIAEILARKRHIIGFTCYVWNYDLYEQILPVVKQIHPETILIMGGPQLLGQERDVMRWMPDLDIVAYKNGETAFTDIIRQTLTGKHDWFSIGGILSRSNGEIIDNSHQAKQLNFADVASPFLEGVITGKHRNVFLMTYRGCPGHCAFCAWSGNDGRHLDMLPMDRVRRELEVIREMGATSLGIFDSNFNQPPGRAQEIFDIILENKQINLVGTSIFAESMNNDLANRMGQVQSLIGVGIQAIKPGVNTVMGRHCELDRLSAGIRIMHLNNLQFVLQMIVGLPGDTYASIAETLNYALQFQPWRIDAFRLMVLPGTEYRFRAEELKLVYETRPFHYVISHYSMSCAEINRAERMAQALTLFYNLPEAREEMFIMAAENHETIIDFANAIGVFIDNFHLLDRQEFRKGTLFRVNDKSFLLEILHDFKQFRKDLANKTYNNEMN